MDRDFISKNSIVIKAPMAKVWESLVNPEIAKTYFWGAEVTTDWQVGSPIIFSGEFNGNKYEEKGTILQFKPEKLLQYTHWSNLEGIPDVPENYRQWSFELLAEGPDVTLSITEDNIPTEQQRKRSDEFWNEVLNTIKQLLEKNDGT
ncbi:MAG: SRPBCC domain-containing protein [Anaerolineales bacterium]|nr:SRPBCC domain-containing protein [Anaerolineales bacterium]